MAHKKWYLAHSPSEKDEKRWLLKISLNEDEFDDLLKEIPLSIGGPFLSEDEDYTYTVYLYGVEDDLLEKIETLLKTRFGEGKLVKTEQKEDISGQKETQEEGVSAEGIISEDSSETNKETPEETQEIPEKKTEPAKTTEKKAIKRSGPFAENSLRLNPLYTFEQFVIGPNSRFTAAAARAVSDGPGKVYNPFFIYGGVGLGKTHLMQAVGHYVLQNSEDYTIMYVTAEKFMSEVIEGIRTGKLQEMRENYKNIDSFLVDDVQFLSESESTQEEFFHVFNSLHQAGKQIILTSDRHPKKLNTLEDRLRSRFEWGLIADIKPPSLETRLAILKKKMILNNIDLDDNILYYIASTLKSNVRELEGFLKRISAYASLIQQAITLDIVKSLMSDMVSPEAQEQAQISSEETESATETKPESPVPPPQEPFKPNVPPYIPPRPGIPIRDRGKAFGEKASKTTSFYTPETEVVVDTVKAAFFYPEGKMKELLTVKEQFNSIIRKHKLKFKLESAFEQTYTFGPKMKYAFFAETCKIKKIDIAVVLGPPTASVSEAGEFGDLLMTLLNGEKIALQLIQWEDLTKDSRYLHLALDITLVRKRG
ncbi:MAG: chromosomal replication initiator protein DnaA [Elusimicrobia bacterium]|nr:chromosomal replication initiator protein DnaA [Elusimicrobiota bacterium]